MSFEEKDLPPGFRVREYELMELIGRGGMGSVYRARHVFLEEERAIKLISGRLAGDKDFIDRFIREAKILTKLRHPNLVEFYEFGTLEEDTFFMVLEFIKGQSVLSRIRALGKIPLDESIRIIREAALGLYSAHQKAIVHRDISPDNLMLVKGDRGKEITKVLDFGIAKPLFELSHHTMTTMFIGKPEYCSPEQCGTLEDGEVIDARSDIYSLAITLYFMIAGQLPFHSNNPTAYLWKHVHESPKPLSSHLRPGKIPEALDRLVSKALSKKREDRQVSMAEFVSELDSLETPTVFSPTRLPASEIPDLVDWQPGQMFTQRYVIEKQIGEGGMGRVYKALDKILEIPVALKIVSTAGRDVKMIERFKREVIVARKVAHPNACRIYDIGESAGIHYVSMEFIEGETLSELLNKQGRLTPEIGIPLIIQVLHALQEAHRVGVIHRDLKPENIMIDPSFHAHIMDFGISLSLDLGRVTQTGVFMGTPHYMAPEQFEGKNIDHRADIYSMGVIMFKLFTGRVPFLAENPLGVVYGHLKSEPPAPSSLLPGFSQELEKIILKALRKEPAERYQNVRELEQALQPLVPPSTDMKGVNTELEVTKLLAEHSYSKAIKLLSTLVRRQPENHEFQKLLRIATTEKIRKEVTRIRRLIHKKNVIQAQLLLEKLDRLHPEETKMISQVRKLHTVLGQERDQIVREYVDEAKGLMQSHDWDAAAARLESAWNLRPNDPAISELIQKIQNQQDLQSTRSLEPEIDQIKTLLVDGNEREASTRLQTILEQNPSFEPAMELRREIERRAREKEQHEAAQRDRRYQEAFEQGKQLYDQRNWEKAIQHWRVALHVRPGDPSTQKWIQQAEDCQRGEEKRKAQLNSQLQEWERLLRERRIEEAKRISESVQSSFTMDASLTELSGKVHLLKQRLQAEIEENLRQENLRKNEIQEKLHSTFNIGKTFYEAGQWEKAIQCWEHALEISDEPNIRKWIVAAQQNLKQEVSLRTSKEKEAQTVLKQKSEEAAKAQQFRRADEPSITKTREIIKDQAIPKTLIPQREEPEKTASGLMKGLLGAGAAALLAVIFFTAWHFLSKPAPATEDSSETAAATLPPVSKIESPTSNVSPAESEPEQKASAVLKQEAMPPPQERSTPDQQPTEKLIAEKVETASEFLESERVAPKEEPSAPVAPTSDKTVDLFAGSDEGKQNEVKIPEPDRPQVKRVENGTLLITANVDSRVNVDGKDFGNFSANEVRTISIIAGEHLILATGTQGEVWKKGVNVEGGKQSIVTIELPKIVEPPKPEPAKIQELVSPPKTEQPAPVPKEEAANTLGTIYIYRTGDTFQGSPSVYLDKTELARLVKGRYFIVNLEPGSHTVSYTGLGYISPGNGIATPFSGKLFVTIRPGKAYYFRLLFEKNTFDSVPETKGKAEVGSLKPTDSKDIRDHKHVTVP